MDNATSCTINDFGLVELPPFNCFMYYTAKWLESIKIDYLCYALSLTIILISIFGAIKENYRWFILNQAVWDICITYNYNCQNGMFADPSQSDRCIYTTLPYDNFWPVTVFKTYIQANTYASLLLLSFMRFLCLNFESFYDKLTARKRILFLIIGFNLFMIIPNTDPLFQYILEKRALSLVDECNVEKIKTNASYICEEISNANNTLLQICFKIFSILRFISAFVPTICLLLSSFAAVFIALKVLKQFKFQLKHNQREFTSSLRIIVVIVIQLSINTFICALEGIWWINQSFFYLGFACILCSTSDNDCRDVTDGKILDFRLPLWLDGRMGLASIFILTALKQLRILFESILVLLVMAGYRESIVKGIKWLLRVFKDSTTVQINPML